MKFVTGNLIDLAEAGEFDLIVQGCNCFNTLGGGLAREVRERYPDAAKVDAATTKGDYDKLGNYTIMHSPKFDIVNAYTQYHMSRGDDVFEYAAFALILQKLAHRYPGRRFGFPLIGCGLAGGDESVIMEMLQRFADDVKLNNGTVTIVKFNP